MTLARRSRHGILLVTAGLAASGCQPNPRNEIEAVAAAALAEIARTAPGRQLCVERTIAPWQPADAARRHDPPAPPGYADLRSAGVFRGGGGLKGAAVSGVAVRNGQGCFDLRGPLIDGDRAMMEVHLAPVGWNAWLRRINGDWRVVMATTSVYPE